MLWGYLFSDMCPLQEVCPRGCVPCVSPPVGLSVSPRYHGNMYPYKTKNRAVKGLHPLQRAIFSIFELREQDLNLRPSGYEPDELPGCSIPRFYLSHPSGCGRNIPPSDRYVKTFLKKSEYFGSVSDLLVVRTWRFVFSLESHEVNLA